MAGGSEPEPPRAPAPRRPEPGRTIPLDVALGAEERMVVQGRNPIVAAAAPILVLLGRLRLMIVDLQVRPLMDHMERSIGEFEERLLSSGVPKDQAKTAVYALCATADDIVQHLPHPEVGLWTKNPMALRFFQALDSGVVFFRKLDETRKTPATNLDLLELMHACLSLGFQGRYRSAAGGQDDLQRIRRDLHLSIRKLRPAVEEDLSPRWQGLAVPLAGSRRRIPTWAAGAFACASLLAFFLVLRTLLSTEAEAVAGELTGLQPAGPIDIQRAAFVPLKTAVAPADDQMTRMRAALAEDLKAGSVSLERLADSIVVRIGNVVLFDSGKADVRDDFEPVATRIAAMLEGEKGRIRIVGHTDDVRLKATNRFKSNFDLSVARAESVRTMLAPHVTHPERLVVEGKGPDEPVETNKTPEGRAANRRIEIVVPVEEPAA